MDWFERAIDLAINILAGVIIFLVGYFWPLIPKSIRVFRLKRFFGPSVLSDRFALVYGTLQDPRPRFDPQGNIITRFQKQFKDGRVIHISGPFENIVGDCEVRAAGYLVQKVAKAREKMVNILSDTKAFDDLNYTFIALGSDASNDISAFAIREPTNTFYRFGQSGSQTFIVAIQNNQKYEGFQPPVRKDYAIILRLRNVRFPEHYFFVCAGLGEWGTSGASWYLATHWESLYKEFKRDNFCVVVEVDIGSDTSAKRIDRAR